MTPTFPYIDFARARAEEEETVPFRFPNGIRGTLCDQGGFIMWAYCAERDPLRPGLVRNTYGWVSDDSKAARTPKE
jgi:hypothetical protein